MCKFLGQGFMNLGLKVGSVEMLKLAEGVFLRIFVQ